MVGREAQNSGLFERNSLPPKTGNWPARTREAFWNNGECFRRSRERRCGCFPEGCPLENIQRPTRQPSAWVCYQKATGRARLRYRPAGTSTFELHGDLIARSSDPRHWPSNAWQQDHRYSAILLPEPLRTHRNTNLPTTIAALIQAITDTEARIYKVAGPYWEEGEINLAGMTIGMPLLKWRPDSLDTLRREWWEATIRPTKEKP